MVSGSKNRTSVRNIFYQPYKILVFFPVFTVFTIVCAILAILISWLTRPHWAAPVSRFWSRMTIYLTLASVKMEGKELIDPHQSYVIVANHQSYYDIFSLLGYLGLDFRFVMKKELRNLPVVGFAAGVAGHFFIDRLNARSAVDTLDRVKGRFDDSVSILIFPEGTRSRTGKLGSFKNGAFRIAVDMQIPVLPVSISGTEKIMPANSFNLRPGKIHLTVHPPLLPEEYQNSHIQLSRESRQRIEEGRV